MPNDARVGLAAGLVVVLAVAFTYFRKDVAAPGPSGEPAAAVQSPGANRVVKGNTTSHAPSREEPSNGEPQATAPAGSPAAPR